MEDLEASLGHVSVCCPKTRCVYRCHKRMAHELFVKVAGTQPQAAPSTGGSATTTINPSATGSAMPAAQSLAAAAAGTLALAASWAPGVLGATTAPDGADGALVIASTAAAPTAASSGAVGSTIDFAQFRAFFMLLPQTDMMVEYWLSGGRCPDLDTKVMMHDANEGSKASPWGESGGKSTRTFQNQHQNPPEPAPR